MMGNLSSHLSLSSNFSWLGINFKRRETIKTKWKCLSNKDFFFEIYILYCKVSTGLSTLFRKIGR